MGFSFKAVGQRKRHSTISLTLGSGFDFYHTEVLGMHTGFLHFSQEALSRPLENEGLRLDQ